MSKISLVNVTNGQNISAMNANFTAIQTHLNSLVSYRQNPVGEPNEMHNDIDYSGFRILNLGELNVTNLVVNGVSIADAIAQTAANAAAAAASAANANSSAVNAAASAGAATATLASSLLKANNLSDLTNVVTARSSLGLGSAALNNTGDFLVAANNLSDLVSPSTARTNIGLPLGTSGATVPLLSTANTWSLTQSLTTGASMDNTVASSARNLTYKTSGSLRWNLSADTTAEGGSNAGSNYSISRYDDSGTIINTPFIITRSTGAVTIANGLALDNVVGNQRILTYKTSGVLRWSLNSNGNPESGSNAGSDFSWARYNDAGTLIDVPIGIVRSTGVVTFSQKPVFAALSKFKSSTVAATSLTNNAFTAPITYTASQNVGGNYVASTGVYTAPAAGEYTFFAAARCTAASIASGSQFIIAFYVNGAAVRQGGVTFAATATAALQTSYTATLTLAANDLVTMRVFQNSGGALTIDNGGTTFFDGRQELLP